MHWRAAEGSDEDQPDGLSAKLAVEFIEGKHDRPFFLAVGFRKPHDPYVAPKGYFEAYPLQELSLHRDPHDLSPMPRHHSGIAGSYKRKHFEAFTERDQREFLRAYFAGTTFMDAQLGKLLDARERARLARNTIVVVLSDHGYLGRSVRTERYRYIAWRDPEGQVELFDHRTDPGEFHNRAADLEYAEVLAQLRKLLRDNRPEPLESD